MAKKNLKGKKKESGLEGTFIRLPQDLKEEAKIWALKNKLSLTDVVVEGIKKVING